MSILFWDNLCLVCQVKWLVCVHTRHKENLKMSISEDPAATVVVIMVILIIIATIIIW